MPGQEHLPHEHPDVAPPTIGALTRLVWVAFRERIYAAVMDAGFTDLSRTHVLAVRYPTIEGVRPPELAEHMNLSKQAINDVMRHLERCGYIELQADPADRRARLIRLTARGHELMEFVREASAQITEEWAETLGPERMGEVKRALADLLTSTRGEGARDGAQERASPASRAGA